MHDERRAVAHPVDCIREIHSNRTCNKWTIVADRESSLAESSDEQAVLRMRPQKMGGNGNAKVNRFRAFVSIEPRLTIHGLEKCGFKQEQIGILRSRPRRSFFKVQVLLRPSLYQGLVAGEPEGDPHIVNNIKPSGSDPIVLKEGFSTIGIYGAQCRLVRIQVRKKFSDSCAAFYVRWPILYTSQEGRSQTVIQLGLPAEEDALLALFGQCVFQIAGCLYEGMRVVNMENIET